MPQLATLFLVLGGTAAAVVAVVVFGAVACYVAAGLVGKQRRPLSTGVRIREGVPGSGKTYGVTEEIVKLAANDRRPIYTNVPVRFRLLAAYLRLKGGRSTARYVQPLGKEHFLRFIERFTKLAAHVEAAKADGQPGRRAEADWLSDDGEHGPHIPFRMDREEWVEFRAATANRPASDAAEEFDCLAGQGTHVDPNWIPYGSCIVIDEVHKWLNQKHQDDEPDALLDFLTMHRHGLYLIEVLSQNAMQVSISFRRQCVEFIRCTDKSKLPFLFGISLPIPAFAYESIPAAVLKDQTERTRVQPSRTWVRIPWLDGGLMWRLYDSFTHVGSYRQLRRVYEATRKLFERDEYDERYEVKKAKEVRRRLGLVARASFGILIIGVILAVGIAAVWLRPAPDVGKGGEGGLPTEPPSNVQPASRPASAGAGIEQDGRSWRDVADDVTGVSWLRGRARRAEDEPAVVAGPAPVLSGIVGDEVLIGGRFLSRGEVIHGATIIETDASRGVLVYRGGASAWWPVGAAFPSGRLYELSGMLDATASAGTADRRGTGRAGADANDDAAGQGDAAAPASLAATGGGA